MSGSNYVRLICKVEGKCHPTFSHLMLYFFFGFANGVEHYRNRKISNCKTKKI